MNGFLGLVKDGLGRVVARFKDADVPLAIAGIGVGAQGSFLGSVPEGGTASSPYQLPAGAKRSQILNPSGAYTVRLPSTGVVMGDEYEIVNRSTNLITVQSSGGNAVDAFQFGYLVVKALVDVPTGSADWHVVSVYDVDDTTLAAVTFAGNSGGSAGAAIAIKMTRQNRMVTVAIPSFSCTTANGATSGLIASTAMASRFRPANNFDFVVNVQNNGSFELTRLGDLSLPSSGIFTVGRDITGTAFTGTVGGMYRTQISYNLGT